MPMEVFQALFTSILPLYVLIALGWVAGRFFGVERQTMGALGIFIIQPIVSFGFVAQLDFKIEYLMIPIMVFTFSSTVLIGAYALGLKIYADKRANLLAMCAAMGNTGYFGLPVALLLLDTHWVAVYIFANLGGVICEATVMYYIANRGAFDVKTSIKKLMQFPTIYAVALGIYFNQAGLGLSDQFITYWEYFNGSYIVIGMMIIGVALSRVKKLVIGPKFMAIAYMGKFFVWPLLSLSFISIDYHFLKLFSREVYLIMLVISIVPPGANISAFAAQLDLNPEKAATTVLIGTIFALFFIPAVLILSGLQ